MNEKSSSDGYKVTFGGKEHKVELSGGTARVDGKVIEADISEVKKGSFHVIHENKSYSVEIVRVNKEEKTVELKINNISYTVGIKTKYDELLDRIGFSEKQSKGHAELKAPMPGLILNVLVEAGSPIQKGDALLTMEAMKMENIIKATANGTVKKIGVKKGDKVEKNQVLITME